jgi:hypothetical protein
MIRIFFGIALCSFAVFAHAMDDNNNKEINSESVLSAKALNLLKELKGNKSSLVTTENIEDCLKKLDPDRNNSLHLVTNFNNVKLILTVAPANLLEKQGLMGVKKAAIF